MLLLGLTRFDGVVLLPLRGGAWAGRGVLDGVVFKGSGAALFCSNELIGPALPCQAGQIPVTTAR